MTLIEMLVVSGILLLLLGVVALTLRPGLEAWRRSEIRSDLQGNALLALHELRGALAATTSNTVSLFSAADEVALLSTMDASGQSHVQDGLEAFQSVRVYWRAAATAELWVAVFPLADTAATGSSVTLLPPDVIHALGEGSGVPPSAGIQRRIARYVQSLRIIASRGSFHIDVDTARDSFACHVESAVIPTLEAFGGATLPTASPSPPAASP